MRTRETNDKNTPIRFALGAGLMALLFLLYLVSVSEPNRAEEQQDATKTTTTTTSTSTAWQEHTLPNSGVKLYHCPPPPPSSTTTTTTSKESSSSLVLLHGARFTKQDWTRPGLLDTFCSIPHLSTTALDLDTRTSDSSTLRKVLDELKAQSLVRLPVSLVTPSASGYTITDWITTSYEQNQSDLPLYVRRWIPVACPSVQGLSTVALQSNAWRGNDDGVSVLAIYGDQDTLGKKVSEKLRNFANAMVVEIPGRHPCYLDSPQPFVTSIQHFLGL